LGGDYMLQGGKDGMIRLLSRQQMRVAAPQPGGELQIVSTPSGGNLRTAPAVLHAGDVTWIFAADDGGTAAWVLRDGRLEQRRRNGFAGTSPVVAGGLLFICNPMSVR
jgi:hypothetical protein